MRARKDYDIKGVENLLLVDHHGHSRLAMLGLRAVNPHGIGVIDQDGEGWNLSGIGGNGHESGEDTGDGGVQGDGLAWVVEVGLRDGVVLWHELELHHVACSGDNVVRPVRQAAVRVADGDNVDVDGTRAAGTRAVS